jgi:transcription termination factor Rho
MSEPVLERSVLERKEREELLTIARAMGASPPSRARKADLVDLILTSAGIGPAPAAEASEEPAKPKPRRRTRAAAPEPSAEAKVDDASINEPVPPLAAEDSTGVGADADVGADGGADADADGGEGTGAARPTVAEPRPRSNDDDRSGQDHEPPADRSNRADTANRSRSEAPQGRDANEVNQRGGGRSDSGSADQGNQRTDGGPNQNNHGNQRTDGGQNNQEEADGNRRRRRRGRDRDQRGGPEDSFAGDPVDVSGLLDLRDEGYGFLRTRGYLPSKEDVYVSVKQVRQFGLRKGDEVAGASRPASKNEKNPALLRIDRVNGKDPDVARRRHRFEDLTPLFPDERLTLETADDPSNMTARIIDLVAPIGKGQRGLIVSPPKAGKTSVLKQIVRSIEANNPEVELLVLLVDERPEEVTDMRRSTSGEVVASTFDRPAEEHTAVAELVIERAKRMVEEGRDVVVILDGITRLARAYNLSAPPTGRIMSGGVDSGALYPPKRFFGSARNLEEGGSLTILATALVETGSRMDEVIFEEFKGTGNMELRLDRRLAERRIYPAIDVDGSSTRHEELLFEPEQLQQVWRVRRALNALAHDGASPNAALERLIDGMRTFPSNREFLDSAARAAGPTGA